MWRIWMVWR
jgi:hypothetical protein